MKKVPRIRFKGFSKQWKCKQVGEITSIEPLKPYLKKPEQNGKHPVIQQGAQPIAGYANGNPCTDFEKMTLWGDHTLSLYKPHEPFFVASDGLKMLYADGINGAFYRYMLETYKPHSEGYKRHYSILKECFAHFPKDAEEQKKIGVFFSMFDAKIKAQADLIEKLIQGKKGLLQAMFPAEGEAEPRMRVKGCTGKWKRKRLEHCAEFFRGNGLSWSDMHRDGKQACILYGHLYTHYGMITDHVFYKTNKKLKNPVYSQFGDVMIPASDTTPTGLARATSIEQDGVLLGGDINVIRPNSDIYGSFLSLAINANRRKLLKYIKGTSVKHIQNSDIKKIDLHLAPSLAEQKQIAETFKLYDYALSLHKLKLEQLKQVKKAFLQGMFPDAE